MNGEEDFKKLHNMTPSTYQDVIAHSLNYYEKISAKTMSSGELYIKVYTDKKVEDVIDQFEKLFNVKELMQTVREPSLIKNDNETGIEFMISFF